MKANVLLVLVALGLGGCASNATYLQLTPVTGDVARIDGRMVTRGEADSVVVVASFEREDMEYLAMDIEIKNRSNRAIDFDQSNFRYVALDANEDTLREARNQSMALLRTAANPALETELVKDKVDKEKRRLKTAKIINTVLFVAIVASDVSSSSRRQSGESWVRNRISHDGAYNLIQAKRVIDHGTFANRMQRYDFESYRWRELALRRIYIQPGESVRGFVYLPKAMQASFIKMLYPVPETGGITFTFMQSATKQRPK
ncbi:MAG: hypothetical protein LH609_13945 [Rudanella sp.]|nr:hypothetical protein [Rudanella sp.]